MDLQFNELQKSGGGKKRNQRKEEKMGIVLRGKTDVVKTVLTRNTMSLSLLLLILVRQILL